MSTPQLERIGTQPIETARLLLRRFTPADAPAMFRNWASSSLVTRFLNWTPHCSVEQTQNVIQHFIADYDSINTYHWIITRKDSNEPFGSIAALPYEQDLRCELSICLGERFWNKGYASEATKAVLHYMLYNVGYYRAECHHAITNPAAGAVMRRIALQYEGFSKGRYHCASGFQDCELYGITKPDLFPYDPNIPFLRTNLFPSKELELFCTVKKPEDPVHGWTPSYQFDIRKDGQRMGTIDLRLGMTDSLYFCGHVGYTVFPRFRGNHYAAKACELLRDIALHHGMKTLIITNNYNNDASRRTCEWLGAKLVRIAPIPTWHSMFEEGQRFLNIFEWTL